MAHVRCVLFDLDGTLIDTNALIINSFQHVLRTNLGTEVSEAELLPFFGEPLAHTLARWAPAEQVPGLIESYRAYNGVMHDRLAQPIPGMAELLQALQAAGIKLGVTTSKFTASALRGLRLFNLEQYFGAVVGLDQCQRHKPDPEPVLTTLAGLGEEPGTDCLMVGDSSFDLLAGRAAGLTTVAVGWSRIAPERLAACRPDHWVQTPAEIRRLCLGVEG